PAFHTLSRRLRAVFACDTMAASRGRLIIMPVRIGLLALSAVLIAVLPSAAKDKVESAPAEQFLCEGLFGADTTEARLRAHFGADNVVTGTIYGPEGIEML